MLFTCLEPLPPPPLLLLLLHSSSRKPFPAASRSLRGPLLQLRPLLLSFPSEHSPDCTVMACSLFSLPRWAPSSEKPGIGSGRHIHFCATASNTEDLTECLLKEVRPLSTKVRGEVPALQFGSPAAVSTCPGKNALSHDSLQLSLNPQTAVEAGV